MWSTNLRPLTDKYEGGGGKKITDKDSSSQHQVTETDILYFCPVGRLRLLD